MLSPPSAQSYVARSVHATVLSGLLVLRNLEHRGACGCDSQIKTKAFIGDDRGLVKQLHAVRVHQYVDEARERQFEKLHESEQIFPCEGMSDWAGSSSHVR